MSGRPRRRLGRLAFLRALRLFKHHHFSVLSGAVLAIAAVFALGDSGFRPDTVTTQPGEVAEEASNLLPHGAVASRNVIYYIVSSATEIRSLRTAIRRDGLSLTPEGLTPLPTISAYFLIFDTPQKEADGARFLTQVAEMAPLEGFNLTVVDLTR